MDLTLGNTRVLIDRAKKVGMLRNQLAYVLATCYWETAHTMRPVKEAYYLIKTLKTEARVEAWRKKNLRYYPWYGRGYVQLTWRFNYDRAGKELDIDLLTEPDTALDPTIAADICIAGMREGWFTGKKLSDYITLQKSDFKSARKIINGTDKDDEIAKIARDYDKTLKEAGYGEANDPFKVPNSPVQSISVVPGVSALEKPKSSVSGSIAILGVIEQIIIFIAKLFGGTKGT